MVWRTLQQGLECFPRRCRVVELLQAVHLRGIVALAVWHRLVHLHQHTKHLSGSGWCEGGFILSFL